MVYPDTFIPKISLIICSEISTHSLIRIFVFVKDFAFKIVSISMALLLLASTTSWKVEKHYCMGHLVDLAFFADAEDCGMSMDIMNDDDSTMQQESSCCSDEVIFVAGQDDLKLSFDNLSFEQQLFVTSFAYSYIDLFKGSEENAILFRDYSPPLVIKNIYKLDETYLI